MPRTLFPTAAFAPSGTKPWGVKPWYEPSGPQMLFPDNRFKSPTSYSGFGLTYACDDVRTAQAELETLLAEAKAARLLTTHFFTADEGHPIAVEAQTVYRQLINDNLVISSDEACAEWAAKLHEVSTKLRGLLAYNQTDKVGYEPPGDSPYDKPDTLDKLKPLFIAGAIAVGAVVLIPIVIELTGISRTIRSATRRRKS